MSETTDAYFAARAALYERFGYVEDWKAYQVTDERKYYWHSDGDTVYFSKIAAALDDDSEVDENTFSHDIRIDHFMRRGVWETEDETMILCDTQTDGNVILCVFDNSKRVP